eukprot:486614-Prorocentrum_lima.AAC.1
MKQQLKELKETPSLRKDVKGQQEDYYVRREELYLPQAIQDEVKKGFEHGFTNPEAGLKSIPVKQGSC